MPADETTAGTAPPEAAWHHLTADQALAELRSSPEGLSADEVAERYDRVTNAVLADCVSRAKRELLCQP